MCWDLCFSTYSCCCCCWGCCCCCCCVLQSIPAMREAFLVKAANGSWRLPRIGELCCRRPQLAQTLDNSECCQSAVLVCVLVFCVRKQAC
jgi:hypothetical protein